MESRETHESGGGRGLLLRKTSRDAQQEKNRSERGLRGAGERSRGHRPGRSCCAGESRRREPSKRSVVSSSREHVSRCPTRTSSPRSTDRDFHRTAHVTRRRVLSEAPRSTVGVVLSETPPLGPEKTRRLSLAAKISSHPKPPSKQERGTRATRRLGARDRPHEGAERHAIALGRFDRAFSVPATEKIARGVSARHVFSRARRNTSPYVHARAALARARRFGRDRFTPSLFPTTFPPHHAASRLRAARVRRALRARARADALRRAGGPQSLARGTVRPQAWQAWRAQPPSPAPIQV